MAKIYLDSKTREAVETVVKALRAKNPTSETLAAARKVAPQLATLVKRDDVRKTKDY